MSSAAVRCPQHEGQPGTHAELYSTQLDRSSVLLSYCCVLFVFPFSRNPTRYQGGENAGILPECAFRGVAVIRVCVTLKREQQRSVWSPSPPFQERLNNNCSPTVLQVEWMSKAPVPTNEQSRLRDYAAKAHPRAELFLRGNDIFSSKQLVPILSQTHLYKGRNKKKKSLSEGILFLSAEAAEAAEAGKSSSRYPRITGRCHAAWAVLLVELVKIHSSVLHGNNKGCLLGISDTFTCQPKVTRSRSHGEREGGGWHSTGVWNLHAECLCHFC